MNENIHYLTMPDGLTVYKHPSFSRQAFIGIAEDIFIVCDDGRLLKAMPPEIAVIIKVTVTDRHLNVINGDIRNCSKLSDESLNYLKGLVVEEKKGEMNDN